MARGVHQRRCRQILPSIGIRERTDHMHDARLRRWGVALVAALVAGGVLGTAPVRAQSVPVVIPPISAIVVGIPPALPSLAGFPGNGGAHSQDGLTWSTTGRADVDVDVEVNRQPGQAAAG